MVLRYGFAAMNALANFIGMTRTDLYAHVNCPNQPAPNRLTLHDAGLLYEGVAKSTLLSGTNRDTFYSLMVNGTDGFANVIREEAAKVLNKSINDPAVVTLANNFRNQVRVAVKGGSYDVCLENDCNPYSYIRTGAGRLALPAKVLGQIVLREYVYGSFLDKYTVNCAPGNAAPSDGGTCSQLQPVVDARRAATIEMVRGEINSTLQTWK
jgi:hypothetical protein